VVNLYTRWFYHKLVLFLKWFSAQYRLYMAARINGGGWTTQKTWKEPPTHDKLLVSFLKYPHRLNPRLEPTQVRRQGSVTDSATRGPPSWSCTLDDIVMNLYTIHCHNLVHLTERCQSPGANPAGSHMFSPNFQWLSYNLSCKLESQTHLICLYLLNFTLFNWTSNLYIFNWLNNDVHWVWTRYVVNT